MELVKGSVKTINNFIPSELKGGIQIAAFDVSFDGMNKRYHGVVANTTITSTDVWRAFWNEENEDDYDFCMTFYYDGNNWNINLSGLMANLGDVFDHMEDLLKELGISKDIMTIEDYDPFDERSAI